jgi:hypothetical protein
MSNKKSSLKTKNEGATNWSGWLDHLNNAGAHMAARDTCDLIEYELGRIVDEGVPDGDLEGLTASQLDTLFTAHRLVGGYCRMRSATAHTLNAMLRAGNRKHLE